MKLDVEIKEKVSDVRVVVDLSIDGAVVARGISLRIPYRDDGRADFDLLSKSAYRSWQSLSKQEDQARLRATYPMRILQ